MIDIHKHILPMVDDGPATIEESVEMCRIAIKDVIKQIIATPHIYKGLYNTDENDIFNKINVINQMLQEEELDLKIFPGGEVHINNQILNAKTLKDSSIFTISGNKKYILLYYLILKET
jgi:protein-tyrosine phosphatase